MSQAPDRRARWLSTDARHGTSVRPGSGNLSPMDAAEMLRTARRHVGLSQRELAAAADVSARSIAAWEAGQRSPSLAALGRVLAAAGLELVAEPRIPQDADTSLRQHLSLSLTQRLRLALGESGVLAKPPHSQTWGDLIAVARSGQVLLEPPLATAMWLPDVRVGRPLVSVFHPRRSLPRGSISTRVRPGDAPLAAVPFLMGAGARVWVLPPAELALPAEQERMLRLAARLLHLDSSRDDAERRRPAHRDPDEGDEDLRLLRTKAISRRPDLRNGRGWRLGAAASLAQHLRQQ
jgi:transcriptional regulator with XRE-family HTH domain